MHKCEFIDQYKDVLGFFVKHGYPEFYSLSDIKFEDDKKIDEKYNTLTMYVHTTDGDTDDHMPIYKCPKHGVDLC